MISPFANACDAYANGVFFYSSSATRSIAAPAYFLWAPCAVQAATIDRQLALLCRYDHDCLACLFFSRFIFVFMYIFRSASGEISLTIFQMLNQPPTPSHHRRHVLQCENDASFWTFHIGPPPGRSVVHIQPKVHMARIKWMYSKGVRSHCFILFSGRMRRYDGRQNRKYDDFWLIVIIITATGPMQMHRL